jgi:hypothetical protein
MVTELLSQLEYANPNPSYNETSRIVRHAPWPEQSLGHKAVTQADIHGTINKMKIMIDNQNVLRWQALPVNPS